MAGLRKVGVADAFTVSNGVCGALAIYFLLTSGRDITLGSALILLGFVFDGADGWAARRWGTKHDKGRLLDSASDAVTFCAAPAMMTWVVFRGALEWAAFDLAVLLTAVLMASLGWVRLYRFTTGGHKLDDFRGLATPATAFLALTACHVLNPDRWDPEVVSVVAVAFLLAASLLMVAPVDYPKLRGRAGVAFAVAVVVGLAAIGLMRATDAEGTATAFRVLAVAALGLVVAYVLGGPVYLRLRRRRG
jgi:CDP-diacylglycerol--serine O-phosphatidyltransferase